MTILEPARKWAEKYKKNKTNETQHTSAFAFMQMRGDADAESISKQTNKADRKRRSAHQKKKKKKKQLMLPGFFFNNSTTAAAAAAFSFVLHHIFYSIFFVEILREFLRVRASRARQTKQKTNDVKRRTVVWFSLAGIPFFLIFFFFFFSKPRPKDRRMGIRSRESFSFFFSFFFIIIIVISVSPYFGLLLGVDIRRKR